MKVALDDDDEEDLRKARHAVDAAKIALGERGPVWWTDGAPDLNRHMARNTSYSDWWATTDEERLTHDAPIAPS